MRDRILVTGANGFVGAALCRRFQETGALVRGTVREQAKLQQCGTSKSNDLELVVLHDRSSEDEIRHALQGIRVVVHLAARVHVMTDQAFDPLQEFRRVNAGWTNQLARSAALQGIRRFVYLSSIKVNGEQTAVPFTEQDPPKPQDPYGVSKWEAEQAIAQISTRMEMETVVVRAPLVYGPGVRGNFLQLLRILRRGMPLPLASIQNYRSLIYLGNLVDALCRCTQDPRAAGRTFLVRDGEDLSTPELIGRLGAAMGTKVCLWSCPIPVLYWMARIAGRRGMIDRLIGTLQVNSSKIQTELGWHPPFTVDAGLSDTAAWFRVRTSNPVVAQ